MARALLALGSNLGDRQAALRAAVDWLGAQDDTYVVGASRWLETHPQGGPASQQPFLNGAAVVETSLTPEQLLARLHEIESRLRRERHVRWGPRTLDLDLLLFDQRIEQTPTLSIPHPRLAIRRFVLEPAAEIASEFVHPTIGWTVGRLFDHLQSAPPYLALAGLPGSGKTPLAQQLAAATGSKLLLDPASRSPATRSGSSWEAEIEFVRARGALLAENAPSTGRHWTISDFWLEQSLAYGRVALPPADQQRLETFVAATQRQVVAPKLTVLLEPRADSALLRSQLHDELAKRLERADVGPVLRLAADDPAAAIDELTAALGAMQ